MAEVAADELWRLRRGVGKAFILFGLAQTVLTLSGAGGKVYFAGYLVFLLAGLGYLFRRFMSTGIFYYEALADFLIGVALFVVLLSPLIGPLLVVYGLWLFYGRQPKPIHRS